MPTDTPTDAPERISPDVVTVHLMLQPDCIRINFDRESDLALEKNRLNLGTLRTMAAAGKVIEMRYPAQLENLDTILRMNKAEKKHGWGGAWSYQVVIKEPDDDFAELMRDMVEDGLIYDVEDVEI